MEGRDQCSKLRAVVANLCPNKSCQHPEEVHGSVTGICLYCNCIHPGFSVKIRAHVDDLTCDKCAAYDGLDPRIVGFPPFHGPTDDYPGCRCTLVGCFTKQKT